MVCTRPLKAYRSAEAAASGGRKITFNPIRALIEGTSIGLPCGQCLGCRIDRSRDWAVRCGHEAKMHAQNSFITLTFNEENCPADGSISRRDLQLFMKRLREALAGRKVRFFGCGEYGPKLQRPHYHILVFSWFPDDIRKLRGGSQPLFRSPLIEKLWPFGYSTVGMVNARTAGYVARYSLKKQTGDKAVDYYRGINRITGDECRLTPEFSAMSLFPGIGESWFRKFKSDCYPSDYLILNGRKISVPKYYDKLLMREAKPAKPVLGELYGSELLAKLKRGRKLRANAHRDDNTPERLKVREECMEVRMKPSLVRQLMAA